MDLQLHSRTNRIIFGPPGTGKTTLLIEMIRTVLSGGVRSEDVALVSYSRQAVRVASKRLNLPPSATPWFRTLHSCAFKLLKCSKDEMLGYEALQQFQAQTGYTLTSRTTGYSFQFADTSVRTFGDEALYIIQAARSRRISTEEFYREHSAPGTRTVQLDTVLEFEILYNRYKNVYGLIDFSDLIERAVGLQLPPNVQYLFVDEGQDLSPAQWGMVSAFSQGMEETVVAGDDDQTIFAFAGADPGILVDYAKAHPDDVIILKQSQRLPRKLHRLSQLIVEQLAERVPKDFLPRDAEGSIDQFDNWSDIDWERGKFLVLSRTQSMLVELSQLLVDSGRNIWYKGAWSNQSDEIRALRAWDRWLKSRTIPTRNEKIALGKFITVRWPPPKYLEDQSLAEMLGSTVSPAHFEYYRKLALRSEEDGEGSIRLMTAHESKGTEEDTVVFIPDYPKNVAQSINNYDVGSQMYQNEVRVLFVAVTRSRDRLLIKYPAQGQHNYLFSLLKGVYLE